MRPMEQTDSVQASPVSPRPRARPYRDYVAQQRALMASNAKPLVGEGTPLWRQMMIWFACAAFLGLIMFVLGTVFISKAMEKKESITIMLCIMGIACGLLIIVGVGVLAKLLITRKTQTCQGRQNQQNPQAACFHTCSVIYTPSQDPLPHVCDPPPAYDTVAARIRSHNGGGIDEGSTGEESDGEKNPPIMVLPPNYDEAAKPIPPYQDAVLS
ncbi:uncharacterized protein LOC143286625 isoform X2 [Babylonia areolata]|uniref:uncharacterized protein LOC143286625 isoform X2 n=1 Tax=Babylonia areolata TaxID=304850 RepID=UPI003FD43416